MRGEIRGQRSEVRGQTAGPRNTQYATRPSARAFTMIEIALSLAIIGFAMVAIIGVLPLGMKTQQVNREETVINQDASVWINAIRNGAKGLDDLTNYVLAITNSVTPYGANGLPAGPTDVYTYTYYDSTVNGAALSPPFPLTNGLRIVGLLSTPKYFFPPGTNLTTVNYFSNQIVAYVRSMSGPAHEKYPQDNASVQDLGFNYRLTSEVVPYWTNYFDPSWTDYNAYPTNTPEHTARYVYAMTARNLQANLHDVRLLFRWPLRSQGQLGKGGQAFRTLVGGQLLLTNDVGHPLFFFEPRTYVNAP